MEQRFVISVNAQDLVISSELHDVKTVRREIQDFLFAKGFKGVSVIVDELNPKTNFRTRLH